jgi:hypothetical protein
MDPVKWVSRSNALFSSHVHDVLQGVGELADPLARGTFRTNQDPQRNDVVAEFDKSDHYFAKPSCRRGRTSPKY